MTMALHHPVAPTVDLETCKDHERKISRACWNLPLVQQGVRTSRLSLVFSPSASASLQEMNWDSADVRHLICALTAGRYWDSEWCYVGQQRPQGAPLAADSYVLGFNRMKGVENQLTRPWHYVKFTVREAKSKLLILRIHPET
jgi:hypothetical protein